MTKLGPHVLSPSADAVKLAFDRSPVVKLVNDFGAAAQYKGMRQAPLVIGRVTQEREVDPGSLLNTPPEIVAQEYFHRLLLTAIHNHPHIDAWEGPNEPVTKSSATMAWYARFEMERMRLLESHGKRAVIGNWSVGQPEPELCQFFDAADRMAKSGGHWIGLHEYSEPERGIDGWYWGRFKRFPFQSKLIITECGTDGIPPTQTAKAGLPWRQQFNNDAAAYARFMHQYDLFLEQCDNVTGAVIFTYGNGGDPAWNQHNVDGSGFTDAMLSISPAPEPTPKPKFPKSVMIQPGVRRLRSTPNGKEIGFAAGGTTWTAVEESGDWVKVQAELWIHKSGVK